jgi:hypothetical protein
MASRSLHHYISLTEKQDLPNVNHRKDHARMIEEQTNHALQFRCAISDRLSSSQVIILIDCMSEVNGITGNGSLVHHSEFKVV